MTLQTQWVAFATMLASGILLGVFLDLYRVLKGRWHLTGWVVALVDLCYWILAAGWVFSVLLWSTWGELRFYMLLILFAGIGLYYWWFSRPTIKVLLIAIGVVQALIHFFIQLLRTFVWTPLQYGWRLCQKLVLLMLRLLWAVLRTVAWLLQPVWRPVRPVLEPLYLPLVHLVLKVYRWLAGISRKVKKVLQKLFHPE